MKRPFQVSNEVLCGDADHSERGLQAAELIARKGEKAGEQFFTDLTCHQDPGISVVLTGSTLDVTDETRVIAIIAECYVINMEGQIGYLVLRIPVADKIR